MAEAPQPNGQPKRYGREFCSDCGNPREPTAPNYSYCIECGRARQRKRYRDTQVAAGRTVNPRVEEGDTVANRRAYLYDLDGKPGKCECCGKQEPDGLVVELVGDPVKDPTLDWSGKPFIALCRLCSSVLHKLDPLELRHATLVAKALYDHNVQRVAVAPIINFIVPTTSLRTTAPTTEQNSPTLDSATNPLQGNPGAAV